MFSLHLLGQFRLLDGARAVAPLPKKCQALLAYLACHTSQSMPRERLAALLWSYSDPDHARQSLRQALAAIRTTLGAVQNVLIIDADGARLATGPAMAVDVHEFEKLARSADTAGLERARSLYRDTFLAALQVTSEPFEEWLAIERTRLLGMACDVQRRLATAHASAGHLEAAIAAAQRLTQLEPLNEDGHRLSMRLLGSAGRRGAALAQYAHLAELLRRELGVAPDRETRQLAEAIRKGERSEVSGVPAPDSPGAGTLSQPASGGLIDRPAGPPPGRALAPAAGLHAAGQPAHSPARTDGSAMVLHSLPFQPEHNRVGFTVDPAAADAPARVAEFFDACGLAWGVERDVTRRITFGVSQAFEAIREFCDPSGPLLVEARCDDFDVDVRLTYHGVMLQLPDRRPSAAEIIEAGDQQLAGYMLRRNADRIRSALKGGSVVLKFRFER